MVQDAQAGTYLDVCLHASLHGLQDEGGWPAEGCIRSNFSLSGLWPALLADVPNYSGRCEWNTCPDFTCSKFCLLWMT